MKSKSLTKTSTILVYHRFHFFQEKFEGGECMGKDHAEEDGYRYIFVRYITKNGKRIYPKKSKVFRIKVKN